MNTLPASFTLSGWLTVDPHDESLDPALYSWFDARRRRGATLTRLAGGGGYPGQGDVVRLSFGIDDGTTPTWQDCGRPNPSSRYVSNSLTVVDGALYAATTDALEPAARARVYRHTGGQHWQDIGRPPGTQARGVGPMIAHDDALYVGAWTYDWTIVDQLDVEPVHVYRWARGDGWRDMGRPGRCRRIFSLASFRGCLYAAGDDDAVHVLGRDGVWAVAGEMPSYPHPMHVFDGRLWVGTVDPGRVYSFDGERWYDEGSPQTDPDDASQLHSFARFGGRLMLGTWPKGLVSAHDPHAGGWVDLGGPADATEINALAVYNGMLYAGALPYAEVARYDGESGWTTIRRLHQPDGWTAASVAESGWRSRQDMAGAGSGGDVAMRLWGRATSFAEHDGSLFVSTGNGTSTAGTSTAGDGAAGEVDNAALGRVYRLSTGTVTTTEAGIEPGRRHIAAVRDGADLLLYVDGVLAASATGRLPHAVSLPDGLTRTGTGMDGEQWHDRALAREEIVALARAGDSTP